MSARRPKHTKSQLVANDVRRAAWQMLMLSYVWERGGATDPSIQIAANNVINDLYVFDKDMAALKVRVRAAYLAQQLRDVYKVFKKEKTGLDLQRPLVEEILLKCGYDPADAQQLLLKEEDLQQLNSAGGPAAYAAERVGDIWKSLVGDQKDDAPSGDAKEDAKEKRTIQKWISMFHKNKKVAPIALDVVVTPSDLEDHAQDILRSFKPDLQFRAVTKTFRLKLVKKKRKSRKR